MRYPPCKKSADKWEKGAIEKRKDGIVIFNYKLLARNPKAKEAAQKACPYYAIVEERGGFYTQGTPHIEPYETREFFEYNKQFNRQKGDTNGAIRKCTFCVHRLESGMLPACVSTCIGRAMYFGDLNDPQSLVTEITKKEKTWKIKDNLKTNPRVYYIGYEDRIQISMTTPKTCTVCHQ